MTALVVCDNLKAGVTAACRYEPGINRTYQDLATHYGTTILPTRVRKPRDKAKVEVAVLIVERWILARLRHRRFFSLAELNAAIAELLAALNARQMRKIGATRRQLFEAIDAPALAPLPAEPYECDAGSGDAVRAGGGALDTAGLVAARGARWGASSLRRRSSTSHVGAHARPQLRLLQQARLVRQNGQGF